MRRKQKKRISLSVVSQTQNWQFRKILSGLSTTTKESTKITTFTTVNGSFYLLHCRTAVASFDLERVRYSPPIRQDSGGSVFQASSLYGTRIISFYTQQG